ncbi:TonB-dependent receptor domain-containing protein [Flavobacterium chungbukense]|uniref:Carboxypeptidase regulatory-like domain-containing protein n=1 Tax=Flavobacterium chungbukense TaxID=877464 RepID=A0ABP7Y2V1_9FLAO|nr:TonB-dependent receptor [Flavobacterium chungbukense]MCC4922287.1 carboxypeptidase regulatory-like domain-containing protein [Flavobacterium chungbukense]
MKKLSKFLLLLLAFIYAGDIYAQGNTTSSINGVVYDSQNKSLPGATILAVHEASGSRYSTTTDFDGHFRISNMRVGGPYKIEVTFIGFTTYTESGVYLQLGDSKNLKVVLKDETSQLSEVVVVAKKDPTFNSKKTGAQTIIDHDKINELPSLSRNIADFARLTPQAQLRGDDVISIGGQNNRFNAIYIDGAVNNDVFGLAANGTNGGQTGVSPISLDAIEQFQVSVSPYDVKLSGFAGGAISAITRSGTNNFDGSAYFLYRDQSLAGKTPTRSGSGVERKRLGDFTAQTYGVRAGGAILKDKLFYFINYEKQENDTPQPFDIANYTGTTKAAGLETLSNFLINTYGYNPGTYQNNKLSLTSDKLIAKIDWNINDNNKLSVKNSYVKATNFSPFRSSNTAINFLNGAQSFESVTNSASLELNTRFNNKFSNNLVVGYTTVNDDRDASGDPFPTVTIRDGVGATIYFGSEASSTANLLNQRVLTITDNFEINLGKHNILIGTHNELSHAKNVFINRNYGAYDFNSVSDFMGGVKAYRYRLGYSLYGGSGDDSKGAADFNMNQFGLYVQDNIRISDNFRLNVGVRADMPVWYDGLVNEDFNTRTIGLLEAKGKDLKGAKVGQPIKSTVHFSPRIGFNYDVNGDKETQVRGGIGVFTSRVPLVWPGGAYNNNGISQNSILINNSTATPTPNFNPNTNIDSQLSGVPSAPLPGSGQVGGNIDLFAKDFKLPQVLKTSLAFDRKLGAGWILSAEAIWNENLNSIQYQNLNIDAPVTNLTGADNRPRYNGNVRIDNTYQGIYLASNKKAGSSWNTNFTVSKNFTSDFIDANISATYAYGESYVWMDATSSQNSSQWQFIETVNGSNAISGVSRSDFDQGSRVLANSSIKFKWNKSIKTTIGLYYEGTQGTPFSYVYDDAGNLLRDTFAASALIYVPANKNEIVFTPTATMTADQQWEAFNSFISNDKYLNSRRGKYAERNGDRLDWSHVIDVKIAQEFSINVNKKSHKLEFTADIFNFTNLLNKNWGRRYFMSNDQILVLRHSGFLPNGTTPTFTYNPNTTSTVKNQIDDVGLQSSRWQMQVGARYSFN